MNNTLDIVKGLDYWMQGMQTKLFDNLLPVWIPGADANQWNSYGRVYVNKTNDGYVPEMLIKSNGSTEYSKDLFFDDSVAVNSFMVVIDPQKELPGQTDVEFQWLFFVDLSKVTPGGLTATNQRLDDIFCNDIENFLGCCGTTNLDEKGCYTRVDKVLEHFSGAVKRDALKYDMQPFFCVRFDFKFSYNSLLNN